MNDLEALCADWSAAKEAERQAIEIRRVIEDRLSIEIGLDQAFEGTKNAEFGAFEVKAVSRLNRKVNGDLVAQIAAELGLEDHVKALFRFKPELNLPAWKAADKSITTPFLDAITTQPGRPSFTISRKEQ